MRSLQRDFEQNIRNKIHLKNMNKNRQNKNKIRKVRIEIRKDRIKNAKKKKWNFKYGIRLKGCKIVHQLNKIH